MSGTHEESLDQWNREYKREVVESSDGLQGLAEIDARGKEYGFPNAPVVLKAQVPTATELGGDDAVYAAHSPRQVDRCLRWGTDVTGGLNVAVWRDQGLRRVRRLPLGHQLELVLTLGHRRFTYRRVLPQRRTELVWNPVASDLHTPLQGVAPSDAKD